MKWQSIRRDSLDVSKDLSHGLLEINGRHSVDGEMRRRKGMSRTSIPRKTAAIRALCGFSNSQSSVNACVIDGAQMQGYNQPYALWSDSPSLESADSGDSFVSFHQIRIDASAFRTAVPTVKTFTTRTQL